MPLHVYRGSLLFHNTKAIVFKAWCNKCTSIKPPPAPVPFPTVPVLLLAVQCTLVKVGRFACRGKTSTSLFPFRVDAAPQSTIPASICGLLGRTDFVQLNCCQLLCAKSQRPFEWWQQQDNNATQTTGVCSVLLFTLSNNCKLAQKTDQLPQSHSNWQKMTDAEWIAAFFSNAISLETKWDPSLFVVHLNASSCTSARQWLCVVDLLFHHWLTRQQTGLVCLADLQNCGLHQHALKIFLSDLTRSVGLDVDCFRFVLLFGSECFGCMGLLCQMMSQTVAPHWVLEKGFSLGRVTSIQHVILMSCQAWQVFFLHWNVVAF